MTDSFPTVPAPTVPASAAPPEPRFRGMLWRADGGAVEGLSARELADATRGGERGATFWIDVLWPDEEVLGELTQTFNLDTNAIEDTIAYDERPKATRHAGHLFVTAYATGIDDGLDGRAGPAGAPAAPGRTDMALQEDAAANAAFAQWADTGNGDPAGNGVAPGAGPGAGEAAGDGADAAVRRRRRRRHRRRRGEGAAPTSLRASRVSMFVLPRGVITVRRDDRFDVDRAVARWRNGTAGGAEGPLGLLHAILDVIVDGHLDTAEQFDDALEDIEDRLFDERIHDRAVQRTNYRLRKELVHFRRLVLPMRDVVGAIVRHRDDHDGDAWSKELSSDFADLFDHVLRVAEWTESLRELVTTIFETNLSLQDARLNTVMKKLTGWAAIIAVPTAITGWFGQNVPYPGSDQVSGLIASTVAIATLALLLFVVFRRKDWI
ncbi:magnesium transporter CorA family protein [Tomitella gaofuii]|uniref:magnesium transporter CorA family protein n=1 Tax=Tomitella gaofuii TaxID=2760083 RepID=UPI0022A83886|nr:magnesium transporter CorA family protein [Tomitella gaofuii]